jgi:hypothetical protein
MGGSVSPRRVGSAVCLARRGLIVVVAAVAFAIPGSAVEPGKASGSITIDGTAIPLTHAIRTTKPNAFDDTAVDTVVILSDRQLTKEDAANEPALFARGLKGDLVAVALRFDERRGRTRLFNVTVAQKSLGEEALLPDVWFESTFKGGVGTLKMARRDFNGHTYEAGLEYAVIVPVETTAAAGPPATTSAPLPPPSKTDADRKAASALLVTALQEGDEARSLAILKLGVDPNASDEKMKIPLINWAVLMCQPPVVKELAELKADTTHVRIPGMSLLAEATAACPDAVPYLKAAGAK